MSDIKVMIIIVLAIASAGLYYRMSSVQSEFDKYKGEIHDQLEIAKYEKQRIDRKNKADLDAARSRYADARRDLDRVLERLRDAEAVPGNGAVRVAGCGCNSVPGAEAHPERAVVRLATYSGTCDAEFYAAAMRQTLQCQSLIDYLK